MHGWWIAVGILAAACLALVSLNRHLQRRAERVRIDRIRAAIDLSLSAQTLPYFSGTSAPELNLKQPDDLASNPPTEGSPLSLSEDCVVRPRRRVVLGGPDLSTALPPRWGLS